MITAPIIDAMGRIPMRMDWAMNLSKVMPYSATRTSISTDVIYLTL